MPQFAANISTMFQEYSFLDRFKAAGDTGFSAVEFLFPYDYSPEVIGKAVRDNGLQISVFNLFPGDWDKGERGLTVLPGRETEFRETVARSMPYAHAVGAKRLHAMAGLARPSRDSVAVYVKNIRYAADEFAKHGIELLIEPINPRSMPGYFLSTTKQAIDLLEEIDRPEVKLQFDIFHHQITRGDVLRSLTEYKDLIGHIQIAGVPDRHEPNLGELNYAPIFAHIDTLGYSGWIGCEYTPLAGTDAGLNWLPNLLPSN